MKRSHASRLAVALSLLASASVSCGNSSSPGLSSFDSGVLDSGHRDVTTLKNPGDTGMLQTGDSHGGGMDACAVTTAKADQTPLDIYFLLDRSGSMAYNHAWTDEVQALETFFDDYRSNGIGVGLGYMPQVDLCDPAAYLPDVPISVLPGASGAQQAALQTSLANNQPFGATPTTIGLEGAVAAATANQTKNPTHTTIIVFSSDGVDINGCEVVPDGGGLPNTTPNAISVIAGASALTPPIKTFVIGITPESKLNQYAAAGGTGQAILIGATDGGVTDGGTSDAAIVDIEGPLIAAFSSVRTQALPCEYNIPQASNGTINFSNVNVTFVPGTGSSQQFYGVGSAADCQSNSPDWYYDNTLAPQHIELCPNACTTVKAATVGTVNVDYGCTTIAPPQ